jgi:hypothetical protein
MQKRGMVESTIKNEVYAYPSAVGLNLEKLSPLSYSFLGFGRTSIRLLLGFSTHSRPKL